VLTKGTNAQLGFAARLAGHWSNGHFIAVGLHQGWTYIVGLLFVNLYFYFFIGLQFRAGQSTMPCLYKALFVRHNATYYKDSTGKK
jgi:nicotinamide riboside transporter PnuC